jgi:CRISPR-associated protein Cas2
MKYDEEEQMWLICMFDLPTLTKWERREASRFRKQLLDFGFSMMQLSVYTKYTPTVAGTLEALKSVKKVVPPEGQVSFLKVSERQYSSMIRYINEEQAAKLEPPKQLTLFDNF